MIQVTTTFIGASATDVETSVATPIEQQVNGVEQMIYMKSTNANDGTLTLKVSFEVGSNQDMDNVLTQEPSVTGHAPAAAVGEELRRHGQEGARVSAAHHLDQVAEGHLRQQLPVELLDHQHQRRDRAHSRRRAGATCSAAATIAMRVWLRPIASGAWASTVPDIANAISQQNQLTPSGRSEGHRHRRERVHVHGPHAGASAQRRGVRQHHPAHEPGRLEVRPEGDRTHRARNACCTTPSAVTTASRRPVIAVFQIPGSNALDVANASRATMADLSKRFPRDMQYLISLDTTVPVSEGIKEIVHTLFEAVGARDHRRVRVPAELARDADPAADGAGVADRRVSSSFPSSASRSTCSRCSAWCSPSASSSTTPSWWSSGDAPHRAWACHEAGDPQGDGGSHRAGEVAIGLILMPCSCPWIHGRHYRSSLSAVRHHDRAVGVACR
jgi:multidrug efflux pump subunit AcrB